MRILMVVPKYPFPVIGGVERQAHELAKALVQRGHKIHTLSGRFDSRQREVESIDGVQVHRLPWTAFRLARLLSFSAGLARMLLNLKREVDVVHVHNISWFGAFATLCAKSVRLPVITKLPNIGDAGIPGMRRRPFGTLQTAILKRSDAFVAMNPDSVAELAEIDYPSARILQVTNGISLMPAAATRCSSSHAAVQVVFVGRLMPQKGLMDLFAAWAEVKARVGRPIMLHLIGDGPEESRLRSLAASLGIGETVKFVGYCGDVPAELAKADVFVLPSYVEGNSNAVLEAMRAGLPVVATRVGGAAIQVGGEGDQFLVLPGDRRGLADRLVEMIESETLRLRLGSAMRARIENLFTIDRIAAVYEEAYELILSGRREEIGQINSGLFSRGDRTDHARAA